MCRRAVAIAFASFVCLARPVLGQGRAEVVRRLELQHQVLRIAQARVRAYDDSLERERRALDTVYVHPFHILVQPALAPLVARSAQIARDDLAWTGRVIDHVAMQTFVVRWDAPVYGRQESGGAIAASRSDKTSYGRKRRRTAMAALLDSAGVERTPIAGIPDDPSTVAQWLRSLATRILVEDLDPAVGTWLGAQPQFDTVLATSWTRARLDLVSLPGSLMRACYDGDMNACAKVLGLAPITDALREWLDAASRRAIVQRQWAWRGRTPRGLDAQCVEGNDDACVEVLRSAGFRPEALVAVQRSTLLRLAIQMGGAGAMERLFEPARNPAERIARVANAPLDSVVRAWHARVHDTRLPSEDLTPAIGAMSLAWIAIFGALSLRSSRWR